ncbi:hypothetical protein GOBAR_AA20459 [Gossypium barbadense]|uniref:Uncharacterized protein n=1 Tax=Gossypium barbadense TaxID=3634 RepID=A0A2P5XA31_GOSBA|nr:hypothetical protein GOBAR_AA20459 [Gossypium barbadense]
MLMCIYPIRLLLLHEDSGDVIVWAAFETLNSFKKRSRQGRRNVRGNAGANNGAINRAKSRKELRSSRFKVSKKVGETSDNHAVSVGGFKPSSGIGSSKKVATVAKEMDDMSRPIVGLPVEPATLNSSGQAVNGRPRKAMEKRPMLDSAITQNMRSLHHLSSGEDVVLDDVVRQGSGGTLVLISDGVLDLGKHSAISFKDLFHKKEKNSSVNLSRGKLGEGISVSKERHRGKDLIGRSSRKASNTLRGRKSRFKAFGNSRVPLLESIEEMAKFISNPNISNDLIFGSEGIDLITDGDTVSRQ